MLKRIAEQAKESEPGFAAKYVRWAIWVDADGNLLDVVSLADEDDARSRGRLFAKCPDQSQGELIAGGEIRSHFLVETAEVVALFRPSSSVGARTSAKHLYFIDLLKNAGDTMPELKTLAHFLQDESNLRLVRDRLAQLKAKPTDRISFRFQSQFVVESQEWHGWWKSQRGEPAANSHRARKPQNVMRCFVTGQLVEPVPTHNKIKGLTGSGGQASGDALVSFDKEAFRSYGMTQSANAAMSEQAMTAYVDGLNNMLRDRAVTLAGAKIIYWYDRTVRPDDDPVPWLLDTGRDEIDALARAKALLDSLGTGTHQELASNHYYILLLSGMAGRVMVRDWDHGQFDELARNIWRWFEDLAMTSMWYGYPSRTPRMERVVTSLLPSRLPGQKYEDWVKPIGAQRNALWRAAIHGDQISFSTMARLVVLCRQSMIGGASRAVTREANSSDINTLQVRMAIMKAYHLRKTRSEGGKETVEDQLLPELNEAHPSAAYHCGRLLAVLAQVQQRALGDVGAGVVERYYASASSTPSLVLGRLTRTSQFHLNKLEPGLARWWEDRITGIWTRLGDGVPKTLTLEEQSLFALGYYQQLAALRKRANRKGDAAKEEQL